MNTYVLTEVPSELVYELTPQEIDPAEFITDGMDDKMRQSISDSLKGRKLSESHKESLRRSQFNRHGREITIDGVTYPTIATASRSTGIPEGTIRGRRKSGMYR